jgi:hypothetical protein
MTEIHGLPAHALFVHFIVVLAPLTRLLVIGCALWPPSAASLPRSTSPPRRPSALEWQEAAVTVELDGAVIDGVDDQGPGAILPGAGHGSDEGRTGVVVLC